MLIEPPRPRLRRGTLLCQGGEHYLQLTGLDKSPRFEKFGTKPHFSGIYTPWEIFQSGKIRAIACGGSDRLDRGPQPVPKNRAVKEEIERVLSLGSLIDTDLEDK
jgi:hypothetical protein